jgi:hypothetical protein
MRIATAQLNHSTSCSCKLEVVAKLRGNKLLGKLQAGLAEKNPPIRESTRTAN